MGSGHVRLPFFVYGTLRPGERNHDLCRPIEGGDWRARR